MMLKCLRNTLTHWKTVVLLATPLALLPLIYYHNHQEGRCAYALLLMATYWLTEALPIAITGLMPIVLFPLLEVVPVKEVSMNYFKDTNMVLFGSLIMAISLERSQLHKRIALRMMILMGTSPKWLLLSFMLSSWLLSMWITNAATTAMMLAVVTAVLQQLEASRQRQLDTDRLTQSSPQDTDNKTECEDKNKTTTLTEDTCLVTMDNSQQHQLDELNMTDVADASDDERSHQQFCKLLVLCVPYASSLGGLCTLTGTATNLVLKNTVELEYESRGLQSPVTYTKWMLLAVPIAALCLVLAWLCLLTLSTACCRRRGRSNAYPGVKQELRKQYNDLGTLSFAEVSNIILFVILVGLWLTRDPGFVKGWGALFSKGFVSDSIPPILTCILSFICPYERPRCGERRQALLDWQTLSNRMPWSVLFLVGGGFALADACKKSGLSELIGQQLVVVERLPEWTLVLLICCIVALLTEVTGNTATANILLPSVAQLAIQIDMNPLHLMIPVTIAASFAFMLPVATAPNAIVFSYGYITISDMAKAGVGIKIVCVLVLTVAMPTWAPLIFDLEHVPWQASPITANTTTATWL